MAAITDHKNETLRLICTAERKSLDNFNPVDLEITIKYDESIGSKLMPESASDEKFEVGQLSVKGEKSMMDGESSNRSKPNRTTQSDQSSV